MMSCKYRKHLGYFTETERGFYVYKAFKGSSVGRVS